MPRSSLCHAHSPYLELCAMASPSFKNSRRWAQMGLLFPLLPAKLFWFMCREVAAEPGGGITRAQQSGSELGFLCTNLCALRSGKPSHLSSHGELNCRFHSAGIADVCRASRRALGGSGEAKTQRQPAWRSRIQAEL